MPTVPEAEAPPAAVERDSSAEAAAPAAEPVPGSSSLALGQSAVDVDLEHGFFSRGLSDEAMQAVTDREGERDFLHQARPPGRRRLISIAGCGALVLVALVLGVRGFFTERDLRTPADPALVVANRPSSAAPAAPRSPQSIDKMPLELVPPVAAVPRIVSVAELRARVPEGPVPPPAEGQAAAPEPAKAEPAKTEVAKAEPAKAEPAKTETAPPAEKPVGEGKSATPTSTQASAAAPPAPSPAQQRLLASCSEGLRAGKYREVESKCKAAFAAAPGAGLATDVAQAALEHGRNADAAAWAKKAIGVDPKLAQAFVLLGGAEQQLGHVAEARAAYSRYLELAPNGEHAQDVRALLPGLARQ